MLLMVSDPLMNPLMNQALLIRNPPNSARKNGAANQIILDTKIFVAYCCVKMGLVWIHSRGT